MSGPGGESAFGLLKTRRFGPLFAVQFLGAFNDNVFKNALVALATYRLAAAQGWDAQSFVTLAGGLFILPFFMFSATAGELADARDKARLTRIIKAAEIALMGLAGLGFYFESLGFLLFVLFLMGVQSTFFGPIKYGVLPQHLRDGELVPGNALIEAGTFLAILIGTIVGIQLALAPGGVGLVGALVVAVALVGWAAARAMPAAPPAAQGLTIDRNAARATWGLMKKAAARSETLLPILGISWFWLVGATFLVLFPVYVRDAFRGDEGVLNLFMAAFTVGIAAGSLLCNRLLRGELSARFTPWGALFLSLFAIDLWFATPAAPDPSAPLIGIGAFLSDMGNWRALIDTALIAVAGGVYIVPLYALLQAAAAPEERARLIASNNVVNAAAMVLSSLAILALGAFGFDAPAIFLMTGLANLGAVVLVARLTPSSTLGASLARIFLKR